MKQSRWMWAGAVLASVATAGSTSGQERDTAYSWQQAHARVLPEGDLVWQPRPFIFDPGESTRYIDFANGDDTADGTTPQTAWKHHPWDARARGNAAHASGPHTYVFKRGVTYRGRLTADESGEAGQRVRLTSDPEWGEGEAVLNGAIAIEDGWRPVDETTAPAGLPDVADVWSINVRALASDNGYIPRTLWRVDGDGHAERINLARWPNWTGEEDPHDIKAGWHTWKSAKTKATPPGGDTEFSAGSDPQNLPADDDFVEGAYVYSEWGPVMGTPAALKVEAYAPQTRTVYMGGFFGGNTQGMLPPNARYYLENKPHYLDTLGEFWFVETGDHAGMLYLKVGAGEDPNDHHYELGRERILISLPSGTRHVEISGLTFRFTNVWPRLEDRWYVHPEVEAACIHLLGDGEDLAVRNNVFEHVNSAAFFKAAQDHTRLDRVSVNDNRIRFTDIGAIGVSNGASWGKNDANMGMLGDVEVMRNDLEEIGQRPLRGGHGHALFVNFPQTAEIAGNVLHRTYGAGLFIFAGKGSGHVWDAPLSRVLIHHNKVTDSLLLCNDWGGIESWQGGPVYIYSNVSGNPGGYWHWNHVGKPDPKIRGHATARFAFAYYLDAGFKSYVFNNIAFGNENGSDITSPHANTAALQGIIGYLNAAFNNTFYNFASGTRQQGPVAGRMKYLGNVMAEIGDTYFRNADQKRNRDPNQADAERGGVTDSAYAYETLAYGHNVFFSSAGKPRTFGVFEEQFGPYETLDAFRAALERHGPLDASVGVVAEHMPLLSPASGDFRPADDSAAIDFGVRMFVPWSLYRMVGEWNFYPQASDPTRVQGEDWYLDPYHIERHNYHHLPRRDLIVEGATHDSYVAGPLEDWTRGALRFDGRMTAVARHADHTQDLTYQADDETRVVPGDDRPTLDPQADNFILEIYMRTGAAPATLVSKVDGDAGYELGVDDRGRATFRIGPGGGAATTVATDSSIADGAWRHLLAELDRDAGRVRLYLDGKLAGDTEITFARDADIASNADFHVGGTQNDGPAFTGEIDFLRVSRGSLTDAKTTIDELYAWQFDGPFLRDFAGHKVTGARRDAGALEQVGVE